MAVNGTSATVIKGDRRRGARRCAGVHAEEEEGIALLPMWAPTASHIPKWYVAWAGLLGYGQVGCGQVSASLIFFLLIHLFLFTCFLF
jgi:hypothetical protein